MMRTILHNRGQNRNEEDFGLPFPDAYSSVSRQQGGRQEEDADVRCRLYVIFLVTIQVVKSKASRAKPQRPQRTAKQAGVVVFLKI
ncbi:MAG: hypothetical protein A2072_06235 [Nitrospirae bacterium GWC1_57_7]|jgi:hypothetical protein|nr:MAG: hypothetical protein A2072_06235 [Nitrospirae bacterium GWC1_57_7]OGW44485.1 MAG: hypothetical protein A2X57_05925 [Nitrospirae bacterium GWD2_57_8]